SSVRKILINCLERISFDSGQRRFPEPPDNNTIFMFLSPLYRYKVLIFLHASGYSGSPHRKDEFPPPTLSDMSNQVLWLSKHQAAFLESRLVWMDPIQSFPYIQLPLPPVLSAL